MPGGACAAAAAPLTRFTDFREDIPEIDVPALILHGAADETSCRSTPPAALPQGSRPPTTSRPKAPPHGLLWTHAEEVNKALLDFLAK